ncbi:hypothetical protein E2C01_043209 [Portunus trituberculatus]|uniref:Uncharacterized protein n=1 Tax=Portunus trituberculatus TaxID=210409 RepID=A0A5B7FNV3_PORTR|nr:hypothetical protein [Portunus trituberculatus]
MGKGDVRKDVVVDIVMGRQDGEEVERGGREERDARESGKGRRARRLNLSAPVPFAAPRRGSSLPLLAGRGTQLF